jgi:hypothetical protein
MLLVLQHGKNDHQDRREWFAGQKQKRYWSSKSYILVSGYDHDLRNLYKSDL